MDQPGMASVRASRVARLYSLHARRLRRIVGSGVRAPDAVIDDACQFAWSCLIPRVGEVRSEAALAWLVTTARREAIRLLSRDGRELPLDALSTNDELLGENHGPESVVAMRDRLDQVGRLPERQQRLVWLAGLGFSYEEMAGHTGDSRRTVERQLLRAKHALEAAA
jgi:RNA polymerase sigma factor (sigma-70 family)